jgi:hypothetical protein
MSKKHSFLLSLSFIIGCLLLGGGLLFRLDSTSTVKIPWTKVESLDSVAHDLSAALIEDIQKAQYLVVGVPSNHPQWIRLVKAMLEQLQQLHGGPFPVWIPQELEALKTLEVTKGEDLYYDWNLFELKESSESLYSRWSQVHESFYQNRELPPLSVVVTALTDAISFNEGSHFWNLKEQKQTVHLLFAEALQSRQSEANSVLPCDTSGKKFAVGQVGCDILSLSRLNYKKIKNFLQKDLENQKIGFATNQISDRDYLTILYFSAK